MYRSVDSTEFIGFKSMNQDAYYCDDNKFLNYSRFNK